MTQAGEQLVTAALRLPAGDRGELIVSLIESLDTEADAGAGEAWSDEIARRLQEIDDGQVEMIDWDEARRLIRGKNGTNPG